MRRRRAGRRGCSSNGAGSAPLRLAPALLLLLLAAAAGLAAAVVVPQDKDALLAFKAGLTAEGGELLVTWRRETDPCQDGWTGVKCSCDDFFKTAGPSSAKVCRAPPDVEPGTRVLQLNFGDPRITFWNTLTGTISPALGNLTALRVLNFKDNHLYGSLPRALSRLGAVERLLLGANRLTGAVPPYLARFPALRQVDLSNNQFTGPLPYEWCNGSWWQFNVQGNAGLCDELPQCLQERLSTFAGTSLIDTVNDQDQGVGGYCNVDPPTCDPDLGCRILRPNPPYFTNATGVAFSFSAFQSPLGAGEVRYRWAIGTTRWGRDVLDWVPFEGTNSTQRVATPTGEVVKQVFSVEWPLAQVSLTSGVQYFITVQGSNDAGQQLGTFLSSQAIVADVTPPFQPEGSSVYSGQDFTNVASQSETSALAASWDPFEDAETGVEFYSYQVFQFQPGQAGTPGYVGPPVTNKTRLDLQPSQGEFRVYVINLDLADGAAYFVRIYATNGAGLEGFRDAPPVVVGVASTGGSSAAVSVSKVVILVAVFVGAASALVALVTYWLMRESMRRHQAARKRIRGQMKNFKYLMQSLVQQVGDAEHQQLEELKQLKQLAFVITDLQDSTAVAAAAPRHFEKVQEMHDSLLRELIGRYHGYEINTEGDAFHVAFKDVQHAVQFCMEVQYQMMELDWPRDVLRLASCREVKTPDGALAYRGPRIRMGVHWADKNTVVQRLHQITKHRVFTGPAFQIARELSEAAHGGQVLLSHEGWLHLRQDMAGAGFPVVEQLGQFKLESSPAPVWIYQITQLLGRPLHRQPGPISGLEALEAGWGLSICQPPQPRGEKGYLAFVAARLALEACHPGADAVKAPPAVARALHELLAMVAMQFGGYIFRMSESQAAYLLCFGTPVDAVRFCHSAQALLMYSQWGADCADCCGKTELAPDGKPIFKGPRVAMAIHQSCEFSTIDVPRQQAAADAATTDYLGTGVERVQQLSEAAHGGQVILSEKAWAAVQDQLPGAPHVVSLGSHLLDHSSAPPLLLVEVMPQVLSRRTFPPPRTLGIVEPGYRDAPGADEPVAFVYVKVSKPAEVLDAEQVKPAVSDDTIIRVLTAFNMAVSKATKLMRQLLRQHRGYECKEPEPGKMTLAFRTLEDAVEWGCALQQELLGFAWPDAVLEWDECRVRRDPENTNLLWRGLRVKMGVSYGVPSSKAPLNTGRADYFGAVPNLAARLMAVARPGQMLVDGRGLNAAKDLQWHDDGGAVLLSRAVGPVEFAQLGYLQVKGLEEHKLVFQVLPALLRERRYDAIPAAPRSHPHSARGSGAFGTSLVASRAASSLHRQGSVDGGGIEPAGRLCSASSMRTPSLRRAGSGLPGGGAPSGHSKLRSGLLAAAVGAGLGRRHSVDIPEHDDSARYGGGAGSDLPHDARSLSVASSGGSTIKPGWLGQLGHRLSGALGRRGTSAHPSEMGSPRSATDVIIPLTSRSGTTGSNAASFTAQGNPLFIPGTAPAGNADGAAAAALVPAIGLALHPQRSASVSGALPPGLQAGPAGGGFVGSFASDSTLGAAAVAATSGGTTPLATHTATDRNSPPLTATRLRDAADWSYPGSTLTTPTTQAAGDGNVDHWEKGLAMEAALGTSAGSAAAGGAEAPLPQPVPAQRHPPGLPPRGPNAQRAIASALDSALAAAVAAGVGREAVASLAPGSGPAVQAGSLTHSASGATGVLDDADSLDGSQLGAAAAALDGPDAGAQALHAQRPAAAPTASGAHAALPSWQSPARILPVPPLHLQRASSTDSRSGSRPGSVGSDEPVLASGSSAPSSSAPSSSAPPPHTLHPPAPQPAVWSRGRPGFGGGRLMIDTDGVTFDTLPLESPDTITPGLKYARQVAQLFVEGRRRSGTSTTGLAAAGGASGPPGGATRLGQQPAAPRDSNASTGAEPGAAPL